MFSNKKLNPVVAELFVNGRKLNIYLFYHQSHFAVPKNIRLIYTYYCINKFQISENSFIRC